MKRNLHTFGLTISILFFAAHSQAAETEDDLIAGITMVGSRLLARPSKGIVDASGIQVFEAPNKDKDSEIQKIAARWIEMATAYATNPGTLTAREAVEQDVRAEIRRTLAPGSSPLPLPPDTYKTHFPTILRFTHKLCWELITQSSMQRGLPSKTRKYLQTRGTLGIEFLRKTVAEAIDSPLEKDKHKEETAEEAPTK
jgi:hypothetical protein